CDDVREIADRRPPAHVTLAMVRGIHVMQETQARRTFCDGQPPAEPEASVGKADAGATAADTPAPRASSPSSARRAKGDARSANGVNGRAAARPPSPNGGIGAAAGQGRSVGGAAEAGTGAGTTPRPPVPLQPRNSGRAHAR